MAGVSVDPHQDIFPCGQLTGGDGRGPLDWHTDGNGAEIGDLHAHSLMSLKIEVLLERRGDALNLCDVLVATRLLYAFFKTVLAELTILPMFSTIATLSYGGQ